MLAAIDEGLATAVFGVTDLAALRDALALPDDLRFVAVVTMGYSGGEPFPERETSAFRERRRQRSEVVRWERWT
jgi:nitroreductase